MKVFFLFLTVFFVVTAPLLAKDIRKAVTGEDPVFDAKIVTSPIDLFIKNMTRPDPEPREPSDFEVPYEEAVPNAGSYYPDEGNFSQPPPAPGESTKDGTYYEGGGQYYLPPKTEESR